MLDGLDALVQRFRGVVRVHGDSSLRENRARVDSGVDKMYGAPADANACSDGLLWCVCAWERRQKGGVHIDDATCISFDHRAPEQTHESRQDNEIGRKRRDCSAEPLVPSDAIGAALERDDDVGDRVLRCKLTRSSAGLVRNEPNHTRGALVFVDGAEQRVEVRAAARREHDDIHAARVESPAVCGQVRTQRKNMRRAFDCAWYGLVVLMLLLAACEKETSSPEASPGEGLAPPSPQPAPPQAPGGDIEPPESDPRTVARAVLEAYKEKDVPRLLGLASAATRGLGTQLQPGDPTYEGLFGDSSWRMRTVQSSSGGIGECRKREEEAQCRFAVMPNGSVAVVALRREEGEWRFTDLLSPTRAQYEAWGTTTHR